MRRKVVGLLLLALVVCAGIVFVEVGTRPRAAASSQGDVFRVILGGSIPASLPEPQSDRGTRGEEGGLRVIQVDPPHDPGKSPILPVPPTEFAHTVRPGDSVSKIASHYLGSHDAAVVDRIVRRNRLKNADQIRVDLTLAVPIDHYEEVVTDGKTSLKDLAEQRLGGPASASVLQRVNPEIKADPSARLPRGTRVLIPR